MLASPTSRPSASSRSKISFAVTLQPRSARACTTAARAALARYPSRSSVALACPTQSEAVWAMTQA